MMEEEYDVEFNDSESLAIELEKLEVLRRSGALVGITHFALTADNKFKLSIYIKRYGDRQQDSKEDGGGDVFIPGAY